MDTDVKLKVLFRTYTRDLLRLTGDGEAEVVSVQTVEIQELKRQTDCVIQLRRGEETYYRHLEFQGQADPDMAARCFRYNTQLVLQLQAPVLTTVIYLTAHGPREGEIVYRVVLGGRVVNSWRFEVLRLWEVEAQRAFHGRAPGLLALVPLMAGGDLGTIGRAWEAVREALPGEAMSPAETILLALASERYTVGDIETFVGRPRMMQSSIWQEALAEGKAEGKAEGALDAERRLCVDLVRRHHPKLADQAAAVIGACEDPMTLHEWCLAASEPDADLSTVMGLGTIGRK